MRNLAFFFLAPAMVMFSGGAAIAGDSTVMPIPDSLYILRDFQINENTGKGPADQTTPDVAADGDGLCVVAWTDFRAGDSYLSDVYYQRFSRTEGALGKNTRANEIVGTTDPYVVSVDMDSDGRFLIAWTDKRNGIRDIYAQMFAGSGEKEGVNFKVNQNSKTDNAFPDVVFCPDGRFVIVWNGGNEIHAKIFSRDGSVLTEDFVVSRQAPQNSGSYYPSVAVNEKQNLVAVWQLETPGTDVDWEKVVAQRFTMNGELVGECQMVSEYSWNLHSSYPKVSSDTDENFVVVWQDNQLMARFFGKGAQPKGPSMLASRNSVGSLFPATASMDPLGNAVICWTAAGWNLQAQRFSANGETVGGPIGTDDASQTLQQWPSAAHFDDGGFVLAWAGTRNNNDDIFLEIFDQNGTPILPLAGVSSDSGVTNQLFPSVATDGKDLWGVVWQDFRTGNPNRPHVFARFFDSKGTTIRSDFQVDDGGGSVEGYPDICMGGDGSILTSWAEYRDNSTSIYARQYTSMTDTVGRLVRVNDKTEWSEFFSTRCTADSDGNFMAVWLGRYAGENGIYGRIFDKNLNPVCPEIKITDENLQLYYCNEPSAVISNSKGDFIVLWADGRNGEYNDDVFFQAVSRDGKKTGKNIKVNSDLLETRQNFPSAVIGPNDNLMVAWIDRLDVYGDTTRINIRRFGDDYLPKGKMTELLSANESMHPYFLRLVGDKKNGYFAAWIDDLTKRVYGRFFDSESGGRSPIFKMTDADQGTQAYPAAASTSDRIVLAWADNRTGTTAYDIWGNAVKWMKPAGGAADDTTVSGGDMEISRNFPNPFRRTSVIQYQLKNGAFVQLKVFNMLGRQVKTLIQQFQEAGRHEVVMNSSDFSSGVYFCQFLVDGRKVAVRKILIMK